MTDAEAPAAATPTATSFGRRLAAERERLGLSVADVAARLRLHPKQVAAIENETLPALPAAFLRGFVRNYAKELRLDPEPLLAELNQRLQPRGDALAAAPLAAASPAARDQLSRRVVVVGSLAALVALAVIGWFTTRARHAAEVPAVPPPSMTAPAAPAAAAVAPTPEPAAVEPPVAGPTSAPAAASAASDGLRLSFREEAWVEVVQGDGRVVFSQLNAAGTERRIEGKPPLRLVIGNASGVEVEYKGRRIDLKPATSSENVARITLQ
jgi:cytoskeleton protein RodZ